MESELKAEQLQLLANLRDKLAAIKFDGEPRLEAIVITPKHDQHLKVDSAKLIPGVGLDGDHPYKKFWKGKEMAGRHISAMNAEVLEALNISYEVPGDNLMIRGVDLSTLEKGDKLKVGNAVLIATGVSHNPCKLFIERTSLPHYVAIRDNKRRGTMFDVQEEAVVNVGDVVSIQG